MLSLKPSPGANCFGSGPGFPTPCRQFRPLEGVLRGLHPAPTQPLTDLRPLDEALSGRKSRIVHIGKTGVKTTLAEHLEGIRKYGKGVGTGICVHPGGWTTRNGFQVTRGENVEAGRVSTGRVYVVHLHRCTDVPEIAGAGRELASRARSNEVWHENRG